MAKIKFTKDQLPGIISLAIIFIAYIGERAMKRLTDWSATSAVIQAIALTAAVLAVFLLLLKCKDYYLGLLTSILAFKMLPPDLEMLRVELFDAAAVYFLVRKVALALFLYLVYRFYQELKRKQPEDYAHIWGIASIMLIFPFISSVAQDYESYALYKTGDYMYVYALQAIAFVVSFAIMAGFCIRFRGTTSRLICDYAFAVLVTRMLRKATSALIIAQAGAHVSKAYFVWIALCAVLLVAMIIVRKKTVLPKPAE